MTDPSAEAEPDFQVALPLFTGGLPELVASVTEGRIVAEDVPLAEIAAQLGRFLDAASSVDLLAAGESVALTAQLLLARPQTVESMEDESRSRPMWFERPVLHDVVSRLRGMEGRESLPPLAPMQIDRPTAPRQTHVLGSAWRGMIARRDKEAAPLTVPAFVCLEVAVSGLVRRLRAAVSLPFHRLVGSGGRQDAVIQFLAVLELIRRRTASAKQDDLFGEITIEYLEDATTDTARAG
jgi:chromatin segregation and condensation protein Rec8/ScpA/Scc1 (kleisin family)